MTSPSGPSALIASAPGKVLITGGYLVLFRNHTGVVLATTSRFYTRIRKSPNPAQSEIRIVAPQFSDGVWVYTVARASNQINQSPQQPRNPFVQTAIETVLAYVSTFGTTGEQDPLDLLNDGLEITIVAHNDFYSQRDELRRRQLPLTTQSLSSLTQFAPTGKPISQVHKTGLGSSAAMTTSLVAALANFLLRQRVDNGVVDKLAQLCHCIAQGKIGSGFDIAAAVWGSHIYRRFDPAVLEPATTGNGADGHVIRKIIESNEWNHQIEPFSLPRYFVLKLAEVDAGSNTPSMVSKVLAWRKRDPILAEKIWIELDEANNGISQALSRLSKLSNSLRPAYDKVVIICACSLSHEWEAMSLDDPVLEDIKSIFVEIHQKFQTARSLLREMATAADVPIEPPSQTYLLDACMDVPGVIMAGVPGAGGYDAIFCITLGEQSAKEVEERVWKKWSESSIAPLLAGVGKTGVEVGTDDGAIGM
ncbi:Phosphomevalonate kinase [Cladochytrium replicatum]|nr:Phosphomevalonate kinase [Cladochytrium replicatum]